MIDINKLRNAKGHSLCLRNDNTGEITPVQADFVEVIRCKDCRFRGRELECTQFDVYTSAAGDLFSPPDWFYCGYGKRKEE